MKDGRKVGVIADAGFREIHGERCTEFIFAWKAITDGIARIEVMKDIAMQIESRYRMSTHINWNLRTIGRSLKCVVPTVRKSVTTKCQQLGLEIDTAPIQKLLPVQLPTMSEISPTYQAPGLPL